MESLIYTIFIKNWQRKILALMSAMIIWFFVSHSITETKMIRNVPIRISNLPADKTIVGLLPNGILSKRINLTLTGVKDVIEEIEPGDIEVNIDATAIDHADWIVQISKKNLISLNPAIDLVNNITTVLHSDFVIKLNRLMTTQVAIDVLPPKGEAPDGYVFLDIWPQKLMQNISGPEEEINRLKKKGLELSIDLNNISKADLDVLVSHQLNGKNNEVSFVVPSNWKQVVNPFRNYTVEDINDPNAQSLRIDFLRKELIAVDRNLPVRIFYPVKTLSELNPNNTSLASSDFLITRESIDLFIKPLFIKNVSRLFLDVIRDYLSIVIIATPKTESEILPWSLDVVAPQQLEEIYVAYQASAGSKQMNGLLSKTYEQLYRQRFRNYLQYFSLYLAPEHKLNIESRVVDNKIKISEY